MTGDRRGSGDERERGDVREGDAEEDYVAELARRRLHDGSVIVLEEDDGNPQRHGDTDAREADGDKRLRVRPLQVLDLVHEARCKDGGR